MNRPIALFASLTLATLSVRPALGAEGADAPTASANTPAPAAPPATSPPAGGDAAPAAGAPPATPAAPTPAAAATPAAPPPAAAATPAAPTPAAAAPVAPTPAAAPAFPESRPECEDWSKAPPPAALPELENEVSRRYAVRVIPQAGFAAGGGLGSDVGFGWRAGAHADVGLLSPLWLSGSAFYVSTGGKSAFHADVLTGLDLVSWGTRWINAGAAVVGSGAGATAVTWNSHCQMRRNEVSLLVGGKFIVASESLTALQAGFGESFKRDGGFSRWSLTGLYDPVHSSYGGQIELGAAGGFLPYPVYFGTVIGAVTGDRKAWWGTIDLGASLEL